MEILKEMNHKIISTILYGTYDYETLNHRKFKLNDVAKVMVQKLFFEYLLPNRK